MSRSILSFALGGFGIAAICLSIDSWLYAGHFLHHGHAAASFSVLPRPAAEALAGASALAVLELLCRAGSNIISLALTVIAISLVGIAADTAFGVGLVPPLFVPTSVEPIWMVVAGAFAGLVGYDLSPGSWRRRKQIGTK